MATTGLPAPQDPAKPSPPPAAGGVPQPVDEVLRPAQTELLAIAWRAASAYPTVPHLRRRIRAQMHVIDALFELGRPEQALAMGRAIEGHRRAEVLADHAWRLAQRGHRGDALAQQLRQAEAVVRAEIGRPEVQEWQCHLALLKIARGWRALGDARQADELAAGVPPTSGTAVDPEWDRVAIDPYRRADREQATRMLAVFGADYAALSLGAQQTTLSGCLHLHARFFDDVELRAKVEDVLLRNAHSALPDQQFEVLVGVAENHLARDSKAGALRVVDLARKHHELLSLQPAQQVRNLARIARIRALAGEREWARAVADEAMGIWQATRETQSNFERAETLRPLAYAWLAIGEPVQADDLLQVALTESAENPNARPRCEDLVETCVELAVRAIEPSPALWSLIREIAGGLQAPW